LPEFRRGLVGPLQGKGGLEAAVFVESDEAVVEERGEFFAIAGGQRPGLPGARIERNGGDRQFDAQRPAITRMFCSARYRRANYRQTSRANCRKPE
jgi:hypothetical protein